MAKLNKIDKNVEKNRAVLEMGYSLNKLIGEGTYSKVYKALKNDGSNKAIACKIIDKKQSGKEFREKFLPRELGLVKYLKHPNIVNMKSLSETENYIIIAMEFCPNGDLLEHIRDTGPIDENRSKSIFRQIVDAVVYLHEIDIAHRDLKCENILLTSNNVIKICDFGFARFCVNTKGRKIFSSTFCGSAAYAAPEIIQGISYDPKKYDIWALGCILYIMISATMPFDDTNVKTMLENQLKRSICASNFKSWKSHCDFLRSLITHMLEPEAHHRLTIREVANSKWLREPTLRTPRNKSIFVVRESDQVIVID